MSNVMPSSSPVRSTLICVIFNSFFTRSITSFFISYFVIWLNINVALVRHCSGVLLSSIVRFSRSRKFSVLVALAFKNCSDCSLPLSMIRSDCFSVWQMNFVHSVPLASSVSNTLREKNLSPSKMTVIPSFTLHSLYRSVTAVIDNLSVPWNSAPL